jgi:hypothetical protein
MCNKSEGCIAEKNLLGVFKKKRQHNFNKNKKALKRREKKWSN